jgi:hypothetical protein
VLTHGHAILSPLGARLLAAAVVVSCVVVLPRWTASSTGAPEHVLLAPTAASHTEASTMRLDGADGWYAIAEVTATCRLPLEKYPPALTDVALIEHYDLKLVGTSYRIMVEAVGPIHWRVGDRFAAHIVPFHGPVDRRPSPSAPLLGSCNDLTTPDLGVVGLIPIAHDAAAVLADIVANGWPVTDSSPYVWPSRNRDHSPHPL